MKIIPRFYSIEKYKEHNLLLKIELFHLKNEVFDLHESHFHSIVFQNSETSLRFPLYYKQQNILIFIVDSIGVQKILNSGIAWSLQLEILIDNNSFLVNIEESTSEKYTQTIDINTILGDKALFKVLFDREKTLNLITTCLQYEISIISHINQYECKDDDLFISGKVEGLGNNYPDLSLVAIPGNFAKVKNIAYFDILTSNNEFVAKINISSLKSNDEHYLLMFELKSKEQKYYIDITRLTTIQNQLFDSIELDSIREIKSNNIILNIKYLNLDNILPCLEDLKINNNKIIIEGTLESVNGDSLEGYNIEQCIFVHRKSGHSYATSEIMFFQKNFKIYYHAEDYNYFELSGIYDLYLTISKGLIKKKVTLSIDGLINGGQSYLISPENYLFMKNSIKKIRPYKTSDNTLAFTVYRVDTIHTLSEINEFNDNLNVICTIHSAIDEYELEQVCLYEQNTGKEYEIKDIYLEKDKLIINIDTHNLSLIFQKSNESLVNIIIKYKIAGSYYFDKIMAENNDDYFSVSYPTYHINKTNIRVTPFYRGDGLFLLKINKNIKLNIILTGFKINKNFLHFYLDSSYNHFEKIEIILKNKDEDEIRLNSIIKKNNSFIELLINLKELIRIATKKYKIYLKIIKKNHTEYNSLAIFDESILNQNKKFLVRLNSIKNKNKLIYLINENKNLHILISEEEKKIYPGLNDYLFNIFAILLSKIIKVFFRNEVWLIGENLGQIARDNGYAFFRYCIKSNIPENVYYIAKKDNYDINKLSRYKDKLIIYDSFKHYLYYHLASYLIVSHGIRDVIPTLFHRRMGKNTKDIIYLQHGIIAMKKLFFNSNSYNGKIRKFVVSSEQEKNILLKEMNFREDQVMITGLPRFDFLENKSGKEILLMPTWREWLLNSEDQFLNSSFFKVYSELIHNNDLHKLLSKYKIKLKFVLHVEMIKYSHYFQTENKLIEILSPNKVNIADFIESSNMLITDYSSIAFDFAYMNKPIIFYQFDIEDYLKHRGSYVNLVEDLPGYTVRASEELISTLHYILSNNFNIDLKEKFKTKKYFSFNDKYNCRRVYKEIKKLR